MGWETKAEIVRGCWDHPHINDKCWNHINDNNQWIWNAEGLFLCGRQQLDVQEDPEWAAPFNPRFLLQRSLIEYLLDMDRFQAEICGWAVVKAHRRPPFIAFENRRPLLAWVEGDAFLFQGTPLCPETLQGILSLAGILTTVREPFDDAPLREGSVV